MMENPKKNLKNAKHIMIFGAGDSEWMKLRDEICKFGRQIDCYVVSSKKDNPDTVNNIPVKEICTLDEEYKKGVIIITNAMHRHAEISLFLKNEGFQNIFYGIRMFSNLSVDEKDYYKSLGWDIKMYDSLSLKENIDVVKKHNLMIYIVTSHLNTHTSNTGITSEYASYIQAGSALTHENICPIKDNTGDNISERNPFFCELTAGYWIYKNDDIHDYVGLYHYSRMFDIEDSELSGIFSSGMDVILSEPINYFSSRGNFWFSDLNIRKVICDLYPEYIETYDKYIHEGIFIPSNMIICKKEVYNQFYKWMFDILSEYEKRLLELNKEIPPRGMGFIAEDLTGVYFLHHSHDLEILYVKQKLLY